MSDFDYKKTGLRDSDISFEYYCASTGKGGQKTNKTASAVRAKHIPTGLVAKSTGGRGREENREKAKIALDMLLQTEYNNRALRIKKDSWQSKDDPKRGTKPVRTYRLVDGNFTIDHQTGMRESTNDVLNGFLDGFIKERLKNE